MGVNNNPLSRRGVRVAVRVVGRGAYSRSVLVAATRPVMLSDCLAYAVSTPLIGGGVAEWLKAAVC